MSIDLVEGIVSLLFHQDGVVGNCNLKMPLIMEAGFMFMIDLSS